MQKVSSSTPPRVKIHFEAKPISNFKNLLEEGGDDEEHGDEHDDES